jgi:hypothetical protein
MAGLLRLAVIAPIAVLLLVTFQQAGTLQGPRGAEAAFSGDYNCDGSVNTRDVITVLAVSGGVQPLSSCSNAVSVDCDGDTDVTDALVLLHYLAATSVSLPAGCSDINTLIPGTSPQDAADQLLARITGGGSLPDVIEGVQEALARGGVPTGDGLGTTYTPAFEPTAASVAIPLEVLNLALEARGANSVFRMDAVQLGQMLSDFGWPFFTDSTPGQQIVAMLKEFVTGAQALPADPNSFTPLFLQAMGKIQDPPVDLSAGDAAPENVHFNLLELRLLVALFERQAVYSSQPVSALAAPAAGDPCTEAKKVLSGVLGPFGGQVDGILVDAAGPHFIEKALEKAGAASAVTIGQVLESLAVVSRLWKLIDFYSSVQVAVNRDGAHSQHKPLEDAGPEVRRFTATAGLSEEDWKAYQEANTGAGSEINQAVRDCMNSLGLNVLSDLGDIAKDAEHWSVDWTISNNDLNLRGDRTVIWDEADQFQPGERHGGNWRSGMVKESEFSSGAQFYIRVGTERQSDHVHPVVKTDDVVVCGAVFAAEPPDLQTLVKAATGPIGLIASIAELGAGWLQTINGPQACRTLTVTWHEPCALGQAPQPAAAGTSPASQAQPGESVSIEAITSLDQLPCQWTGTAHASTHYYASNEYGKDEVGSMDATFTFGNPQLDPISNSVGYKITSGSATWHASGTYSGCSFSKSGTVEMEGSLAVSDDGSGHLTYVGLGGSMSPRTDVSCGYAQGTLINTTTFFNTCLDGLHMHPWPLTSLDLSGSCIEDQPSVYHNEFSWHLSGISCAASAAVTPQAPVCGGAAAGP